MSTVDMETLIEKRGTWSLDAEALQHLADAVIASVVRQAAEINDQIAIKVGDVVVGTIFCTTRYDHTEVEEMIGEHMRGQPATQMPPKKRKR